MNALINTLKKAALGLALLGLTSAALADTLYHVDLDTTQLSGAGWIDLQFNPGLDGAPLATANLIHFQGLVTGDAAQIAGGVTGHLGGNVNFNNSTAYNDLFQGIQFGQRISFDINFGGAYANSVSNIGTTFGLALYQADQATPVGHGDAISGNLLSFDLTPAISNTQPGAVAPTVFDASLVNVHAVPEPSEWLMMVAGLAALGGVAQRRRAQRA